MYRVGLPVWLIRLWKALHSIRIVSVVSAQLVQGNVVLDAAIRPSYPAIFTAGSPMDKYHALVNHLLGYLAYPDPFGLMRAQATIGPPPPLPRLSRKELRSQRYTPCKSSLFVIWTGINHR